MQTQLEIVAAHRKILRRTNRNYIISIKMPPEPVMYLRC